jgi:long-chain acyl-CoA synthetase
MGRLVSGTRELALADLQSRAARAAAALESIGVKRGDAIAVMLRNDFAFFEAQMGAGQLGAYCVPVNWHFTVDEAAYVFRDCGAKAIVAHTDFAPVVQAAAPTGTPVYYVPCSDEIAAAYNVPGAARVPPAGAMDWNGFISVFAPRPPVAQEPPGAMIYTSGTTGRPKGVRRQAPSPAQAAAQVGAIGQAFGYGAALTNPGAHKIVSILTGPMYHSAPNTYANYGVRAGAEQHLQPRFDPEQLLQWIQRFRVTNLHMVPTMFVRLLKLPADVRRKYDVSSLKFVVHAAAPCPIDVKRAMIEWWGPVINEYYGATETGAITFCTSEEWLAHPGTVGRPMPGTRVRIVDEAGHEVPKGESGEVYMRLTGGPDFTYHGDDAKRAQAERDGLVTAGDIGRFDADGFLHLMDRRNNMVISGGVNIYPAEIESVLLAMPGVADCAVFGIPDDEFGEALCAAVQPQPGVSLDAALVRAHASAHLAKYKVPKRVEFMAALPREDSGKIFTRKLKAPYWAGREKGI